MSLNLSFLRHGKFFHWILLNLMRSSVDTPSKHVMVKDEETVSVTEHIIPIPWNVLWPSKVLEFWSALSTTWCMKCVHWFSWTRFRHTRNFSSLVHICNVHTWELHRMKQKIHACAFEYQDQVEGALWMPLVELTALWLAQLIFPFQQTNHLKRYAEI